ncbi:MAG: Ldh family oxidoreductase, partial [Actinomycetes bacterium]
MTEEVAGRLAPREGLRVGAVDLRRIVRRIFEAAGVSEGGADAVAGSLVDADLRGVTSHGAMLVPMYVDRILCGSVRPAAQVRVVAEGPATAVLDAQHTLGQISGDHAMDLAVEKARACGVGVVVVCHAFHFGGAFRYVERAARLGCIAIAASNTRPLMPAPGGTRPVVGNSPIAVGVPRAGDEPILLDMALSEAALGKIRLAAAAGEDIPLTWATDARGVPTADPAAAVDGMLLPMGGHKGFGLALVVDLLSGVLS